MQPYHFIAIGGIGMSALARILLQKGALVSGSDEKRTPLTDRLEAEGARVFIGYSSRNLPSCANIVYSTHVINGNPEFDEAKKAGLPLMHRSQLLAQLMREKKPLLVAGTHGKTTTSSLLTHVLHACGLNPSYAVGGIIHTLGNNGGNGTGDYFVAEACESDGTFLEYPCFGGIVTNIDDDHLDFWKTKEALMDGFSTFLGGPYSPDYLLYCIDDEPLQRIAPKGTSYGFSKNAEARITGFFQEGWEQYFTLSFLGKTYKDIFTAIVGKHNILNSAAVFALGLRLGIAEESLRKALRTFQGIGRRLEKRGEKGGILLLDDYGHHPTEIATTLEGLKKAVGDRRLVVVFQPHRYTRTRDCMDGFPRAFDQADVVCITDIYSAGEPQIPGVDIEGFVEKVREAQEGKIYYFSREALLQSLAELVREGDVVLTIGAGDVTKIGPELMQRLQ
jgi:UDP-N-acetylmuramate--alanine ligase